MKHIKFCGIPFGVGVVWVSCYLGAILPEWTYFPLFVTSVVCFGVGVVVTVAFWDK